MTKADIETKLNEYQQMVKEGVYKNPYDFQEEIDSMIAKANLSADEINVLEDRAHEIGLHFWEM